MAVATDAMICTMNLMVSFFVIVDKVIRLITSILTFFHFYILELGWGKAPNPYGLVGDDIIIIVVAVATTAIASLV